MKKPFLNLFISVLLLVMAGCQSNSASGGTPEGQNDSGVSESQGEELNLAFSTWVGYAPFYIAEEKGFFEKNGVKVHLTRIESTSDRLTALAADQIQAVGGTVDSHISAAANDIPLVQVLVTEDSNGGDGIVAEKEFTSLKDLKGQKVAVQTDGGASFFWFNYLLQQEGMTMDDFDIQSMSSGDAGAAFVAKKVDAAITWEPWLTTAKDTDFGHVLMDSSETPGVITGAIAMREDYVAANPEQVQAFVDSWFEAVEFYKENPVESIEIMAESMSQTTEEFEESITGVTWYDEEMAKEYFGTAENPGALYELSKMASDLWIENDLIDKEPNLEEVIDYSFITK